MEPKDIDHLHYLRFDEKVTLKDLLQIIKEDYGMSLNFNEICAHYSKHLNTAKQAFVKKENKSCGGGLVEKRIAKVAEVLSPMVAENVAIDQKLETAYASLVTMTQDFVHVMDKLKGFVDKKFEDPIELDIDLGSHTALSLLGAYTAFNKELRGQIKDVNALRAPKLLMIQFMEASLKRIIEEMSMIFSQLCASLQEHITHDLRKNGAGKFVNDQLFSTVFQKVAMEYQKNMTDIVRDQLHEARSALAELAKVQ